MPEQPQSINVTPFKIAPVQLKPVADILLVQPDRSAKISYILGKLIPGTPEVPAVPGVVGKGMVLDQAGNVVTPAVEGKPAIPAVPATPDAVTPIDQGQIDMTDAEWAGWGSQDDQTYRAGIVAARLGLTLNQ